MDTEIPSPEGFSNLGVPGDREAGACSSVGNKVKEVFRTEDERSGVSCQRRIGPESSRVKGS